MTGDDPPGGRPSSGAGVNVLGGRTQEVVAELFIIKYCPLAVCSYLYTPDGNLMIGKF